MCLFANHVQSPVVRGVVRQIFRGLAAYKAYRSKRACRHMAEKGTKVFRFNRC